MKRVLVLGCTGSIGTSTLDIIRNMPDSFVVSGLSAHTNVTCLSALAAEFDCPFVLTKSDGVDSIRSLIEKSKPDIVVNGIAGAAGLLPSLMVLEAGVDLALANKETIVMAFSLVKKLAEKNGCQIIPVDSEHSAIFTLIHQCGKDNIDSIIITASGGPFRTLPKEQLSSVTASDALKHPTWRMGKKITVDSATLANKGLEVIEASKLFTIDTGKINVIIHPQSLIHSMVRLHDGVLYAQISAPDMRHPLLSALSWPDITHNYMRCFDLFEHEMTFYKPRWDDFPMLKLAFEAAKSGGAYTIAYNAADEVAALAFMDGKIGFMDIPRVVHNVLDADWLTMPDSFDSVFEYDKIARSMAEAEL